MQHGENKESKEGAFVDDVFELGRVRENGIKEESSVFSPWVEDAMYIHYFKAVFFLFRLGKAVLVLFLFYLNKSENVKFSFF